MATFPDEIIIEILTRLSTKSLIKFRCVSKPWCRLISDSKFIQMHYERALERDDLNLFISCTSDIDEQEGDEIITKCYSQMYSLDFNSSNEAVEIIIDKPNKRPLVDDDDFSEQILFGSCNVLVCTYVMGAFCLLNPLTREFKLVNFEYDGDFWSKDVYGFGYDANAGLYSGVCVIWNKDNSNHSKVEVFSFSDTTDVLTINVPYKFKSDGLSGIYLNGALHWVVFPNPVEKKFQTIVSFSLREKVFQELPRPDKLSENGCINVGLLRRKLSFLYFWPVEIWIMNKYGVRDSWYKLCAINHAVIPAFYVPWRDLIYEKWLNVRPLCICKNGEIMLTNIEVIVLYDPRQSQTRNLEIHGMMNQNILEKVTHISSLVSLR